MLDKSEEIQWDASALKELNKLPFMKKVVKLEIEKRARNDGVNRITLEYLEKYSHTAKKKKRSEIIGRVVGIVALVVLILALYYLYLPAMFIILSKENHMLFSISLGLAYIMGVVIIWSLKSPKIVRIGLFGLALCLLGMAFSIYYYFSHAYGLIISAVTFIVAVVLSLWRLLFVRR